MLPLNGILYEHNSTSSYLCNFCQIANETSAHFITCKRDQDLTFLSEIQIIFSQNNGDPHIQSLLYHIINNPSKPIQASAFHPDLNQLILQQQNIGFPELHKGYWSKLWFPIYKNFLPSKLQTKASNKWIIKTSLSIL